MATPLVRIPQEQGGTLYAFARVCNLRNKDDAQKETREVTRDIAHHMKDQFPVSSKYLLDKE